MDLVREHSLCNCSHENAKNKTTFDGKSVLIQLMAWDRQATGHLPESILTKVCVTAGVALPQWVKDCV